jgi:hypothetical protein
MDISGTTPDVLDIEKFAIEYDVLLSKLLTKKVIFANGYMDKSKKQNRSLSLVVMSETIRISVTITREYFSY